LGNNTSSIFLNRSQGRLKLRFAGQTVGATKSGAGTRDISGLRLMNKKLPKPFLKEGLSEKNFVTCASLIN
jgi:hypothetical protein